MNFIPLTEEDKKQMLASIGVGSIEDLVSVMQPKLGRELNLPEGLSEMELVQHMKSLSEKNAALKCFRGAGAYPHYSPSTVNQLIMRGEFFTAYTPYQPEVSQGTLQAIYEFQTLICQLTRMEVANASMYDCATALAEGVIISRAANGRKGIAIWGEVNPEYKATLRTYADAGDFVFTEKIDAGTACVVVQYPDYHGNITDLAAVEKEAHAAGALLVVAVSDPSSLALLKPPGEFNADIVVGELQPFGNSMSFGGPGGGFMAIKNEFVKRMPGRLCGMSLDTRGQRAFILTLQAREQHIKREKATSNLCTNQGLNSLVAVIYLSLMGPKGLRQAASLSYKRAHTLQKKLEGLGFKLQNAQPFYNEFAVSSSVGIEKLNKALLEKGMLGGADLGNGKWLLCCTELISEKDIEKFVDTVKTCL